MSHRKITIIDVAARAGVSIASVSRFLNKTSSLRKDNRERIAKAIKDLNYKPFIHAQRLAGGKLNSYGLIIPGYEGIFYSFYALEIIRNVCLSLDRKGIDLHLNIYWNKDNFKSSLVDGALLADVINNEQQIARLQREEVPFVVMNKKVENDSVSYVAIDNVKGAYDATDFLIKHGHKKIAHLAGDLRVQCGQERLDGYKKALVSNKINLSKQLIKITDFSRLNARRACEELFADSEPPTAVFSASDEMAQEVLNYAQEVGIKVPKELSVVGFDDNPHCGYQNLAFTTVRQPLEKMAATAVELLKSFVDTKDTTPKRIVLDPELVIRDTVDFL